jgi:hypothetical protein
MNLSQNPKRQRAKSQKSANPAKSGILLVGISLGFGPLAFGIFNP